MQRRPQDVIQVPRLEPKDLFEKRNRRDFARLRAYNKLLEQIYQRVYSSSQLSGLTSSILYSVPPFIFGLPKLDMEDCIVYLVFQLRQAGFEVHFTWPNLLRISWKHHEIEYLAKQNPIIQAMVPEAPPKPSALPAPQSMAKKKQLPPRQAAFPDTAPPTVSFSSDIDFINSSTPLRSTPAAFSEPRRASDYQPPPSFIQTMERPQKETRGPIRNTGGGTSATANVLEDLWRI